ncbi:MAG: heparinase II/III family protein [Rhodospirillales bacterium]
MLAGRHLKRAGRSSPGGLLRFGAMMVRRRFCDLIDRRQATWSQTYSDDTAPIISILDPLDVNQISAAFTLPDAVIENWRSHRFDILGSGWVATVSDGIAVSAPNGAISRRIAALLPAAYQPVDWHRDLNSGHRWQPVQWHRDVPIPLGQGVDIKSPWELARCHHLPAMALAAVARGDADLAVEVRAQMLDFIAANPPKFGVNWRCAMDVAIRAANWVVADSVLRSTGLPDCSDEISDILSASLLDHGRFITGNLEWYPDRTGNHYLANISGLAFIAAALDPLLNDEAAGWLKLVTKELEREVAVQFLRDGGHFEGSVAYHRLCLELAIWGTGVCHRAGSYFTAGHYGRLAAAAEFLSATIKPSGDFVQIGDNDSGRFLNLCPEFGDGLQERQLTPQATLDAAAALLSSAQATGGMDGLVMSSLTTPVVVTPGETASAYGSSDEVSSDGNELVLPYGAGLDEGIQAFAFPDFGLFILRGKRLWLSVRCGGETDPIGAHRHHDQLSVELTVDGRDIIRDPGTYIYTPDPAARNAYRAISAHFTPQYADGREPASLDAGLFFLDPPMGGTCMFFDETEFLGWHAGSGAKVWREVQIRPDRIIIRDRAEGRQQLSPLTLPDQPLPFSPGYGRRENSA